MEIEEQNVFKNMENHSQKRVRKFLALANVKCLNSSNRYFQESYHEEVIHDKFMITLLMSQSNTAWELKYTSSKHTIFHLKQNVNTDLNLAWKLSKHEQIISKILNSNSIPKLM